MDLFIIELFFFFFKNVPYSVLVLSKISSVLSEKAMASHSSTLTWRIPWMEEPGGLPSMGSHTVGHNRSDLAAVAVYV